MKPKSLSQRLATLVTGSMLSLVAVASTGCQVDVAGQTLPSPYYLQDDLQHFGTGPEFKLSNEAAAMQAAKAESLGEVSP